MLHFCQDEALAIGTTIPLIGVLFRKAHKWYHNKIHHKCHHQGCDAEHAEHLTSDGETAVPNLADREALSIEKVDAKFGNLATIFLTCDRRLIKSYTFPDPSEFAWFLAPGNQLEARWKNKFFSWNGSEWSEIFNVVPLTKDERFDKAVGYLRLLTAGEHIPFDKIEDFLGTL